MAQRIIMIILILTIVIGGGFYAYKELMPTQEKETNAPVYSTKEITRGNISVGVETTGGLEPSNQGGLRVPRPAGSVRIDSQYEILEFLVKEGDAVKRDQAVAILNSPDLETKIKEKQTELETKCEQLAEMCQVPVDSIDSINPLKGITIVAPIDGRITDLNIVEGAKLDQGNTIARIIDDSVYKLEARLLKAELDYVKEGMNVIIKFPYFEGTYEGTVKRINYSPVPDVKNEGFAETFVHYVYIEGENPGLIQRDMEAVIGVKRGEGTFFFSNKAKVAGFVKEERIINTIEAIVTKVYTDNMSKISKGEPIITMSGTDVQDLVQEKLDEIKTLRGELRELQAQEQALEIKAPMDGIVAGFYRQVGEIVNSGEWIGSIYTVSDMRLWSMVDDIDILNVKQGAPVKVTVDAVPNKTFKGEVTYVSTMAEQINNVSKFRIEMKVEGSAELRPGMQARAYIDAGSAENVLLVPLEAVFEEGGKTMVEILKPDGTTTAVQVKLGLMNDRFAEVKSGLNEGDMVVTGSSADLLPSQHIKTQGTLMPENTNDEEEESGNNSGNNGGKN